MSPARVRLARWEDREAIVGLMEAMGGHDGARERLGTLPNLARTLRGPAIRVLVAEADGLVLGWIEVHRRPSPIQGRTEAWIQSLCVAPEARGRRIGRELIEAAAGFGRELGVDVLTVDTSVHRKDTHRFYYANARPPAHSEENFYDLAAEEAALAALAPLGLTVLTEERGVVGRIPEPGEPWIALDPIDGTRNHLAGLPPWGISIGLVVDERPLAGWVGDLTSGRSWSAVAGEGAFADGRRIQARDTRILLLPSTSPTGVPALDDRFERLRVVGSAALSLCYVAAGAAVDQDGERPALGFDPERRFNICAAHDLATAAATAADARALQGA